MKKVKKFLLMTVLSVCSFAFVGIVNAELFTISGSVNLICEPNAIEAGGQSECYVIGKPDPATETASVNGYVVQSYTTKNLTLQTAKANENVTNSAAVFTHATAQNTNKPFASTADAPKSLQDFTCIYDSAASGKRDFGCAVYYTKSSVTSNAFTPAAMKRNAGAVIPAQQVASGYGVLGSIIVKLSEDATNNECGELCVKVWRIDSSDKYDKTLTASVDDRDNMPEYFCKEIHLKGTPVQPGTPETGAFASYAILAAGALIAISAVAMAKKNNKFNRI